MRSVFKDVFVHDACVLLRSRFQSVLINCKRLASPLPTLDHTIESLSRTLLRTRMTISSMIAALNQERNARASINLLPVEILLQIFKLAGSVDTWNTMAHIDQLKVSHICSHWRSISLAHPDLWTHISLSKMSEALTQLFLRRSMRSSLLVEYSVVNPALMSSRCTYLEQFCQEHMQRARAVNIIFNTTNSFVPPYLFPSLPYETLQELSLSQLSAGAPNLIQRPMPRLRNLTLDRCLLKVNPTYLQSLTTLHLAIDRRATSFLLDLPDIFRNAPHLEIVAIEKARDSPPTVFRDYTGSCVPLPAARHVSLSLEHCDLRWLLSSITIPPLATVMLRMSKKHEYIFRCYPSDHQCLPCLTDISTVVVSIAETGGGVKRKVNECPWLLKMFTGSSAGVIVDLGQAHWKSSPVILDAAINEPLRRNMGRVTTLSFDGLRDFSKEQRNSIISILLSRLPDLQLIQLIQCSPVWLLSFGAMLAIYSKKKPLSLDLASMFISTTVLRRVCELNRISLSGGCILLRGCTLQTDEASCEEDLHAIQRLGIQVGIAANPDTILYDLKTGVIMASVPRY